MQYIIFLEEFLCNVCYLSYSQKKKKKKKKNKNRNTIILLNYHFYCYGSFIILNAK